MMDKKEKTRKKPRDMSKIIFLVVGGVAGFLGAYFSDLILGDFIEYVESYSVFIKIPMYLGLVIVFTLGFLIHVIIHEAGHLIFGLMSGYSFISFRVGSFIITKEDGKFKISRYNIPGTAGQCLLMPPEKIKGKYPFVLYNSGGVLINLLATLLSILILIFGSGLHPLTGTILALFSIAGVIVILTNGIPMKAGGIPNDAHNILSMLRDENAREGFYIQLQSNGLKTKGMRTKDMAFGEFHLEEDADLSNPLNTYMKLMEYEWYLDNGDYDRAREILDSLLPYMDDMILLYRHEINLERIYLELLGDCDRGFIDHLYDKNLKKYVKMAKHMINKKRILMAYEGFYNNDKEKALKYYKEMAEMKDKYPNKGDMEMELILAGHIKERLGI